jgi:hypothetical protein
VEDSAPDFRPQQEAEVDLKAGRSILEFPDFVHLCLLRDAPSQDKLLKLCEQLAGHSPHVSAKIYRQGATNSSAVRAAQGLDSVTFGADPEEERPFGSIIAFD